MNFRNWISPNAVARSTMANPLGMGARATTHARVPLGIMFGPASNPVAPRRATANRAANPCPSGYSMQPYMGTYMCRPKPGGGTRPRPTGGRIITFQTKPLLPDMRPNPCLNPRRQMVLGRAASNPCPSGYSMQYYMGTYMCRPIPKRRPGSGLFLTRVTTGKLDPTWPKDRP